MVSHSIRLVVAILLSSIFGFYPSLSFSVPLQGQHMMIAGPSDLAARAGQQTAKKGGNLIDVAVTVGLSLAVVTPYYAALGGGGFALVRVNNTVQALDFRETSPSQIQEQDYKKKGLSETGGLAVGVPGFPAGLIALHEKYGHLKWAELFTEPIKLAEQGFAVTGEWVESTREETPRFTEAGAKIFKSNLKPGDLLRQPGLAQALKLLRDKKGAGFYQGSVAQDLIDAVNAAGGRMSPADLKNYQVKWRDPMTTTFAGRTIYLMPPPSSSGVVIKTALKLIEDLDVTKKSEENSSLELHLLAEILHRSFRGRPLLGDPDFSALPIDKLTSSSYLEELKNSVSLKKTTPMAPFNDAPSAQEKAQTTHFSIADSAGNAIALTVTLNGSYGSGVVTPKYGIALNNEMDDFNTQPGQANMYGLIQGHANRIQPGKRPLSSMSPTIVVNDKQLELSLGSPGGPRIMSGVIQTLFRILGRKMDIDSAIQAPRVHQQFQPPTLFVDRRRFAPEVLGQLKSMGHQINESWMGKVYVVRLRPDGVLEGAFDSRGEGSAHGW